MNRIGLVLGGGGVTGASYQIATLMALELATGWDPGGADTVVGTSGGAYVAALVRSERLDLDSLVREGDDEESVADRIRLLFHPRFGVHLRRWLRHGLVPALRRPGLTSVLGSPARYSPVGIAAWVRDQVGEAADGWPDQKTLITAYDLERRQRAVFGSTVSPPPLAEAVAASSAIPVLFHPHPVAGRHYVDGGVASGTHADLVLGDTPLDLVIVVAPMAGQTARPRAWPHERLLDRLGRNSLERELALISEEWPDTDVLVLSPPAAVLAAMRPNPMAPAAAIPTFVRTVDIMREELAAPPAWELLSHNLVRRRAAS